MLAALSQIALAAGQPLVLTLQYRPAQEVVPWIESMVGETGSVAAQGGQLLISASPARLAQIKAVVERLDVPYRNLEITVKRAAGVPVQQDAVAAVNSTSINPAGAQAGGDTNPDSSVQGATVDAVLTVVEGEQTFVRVASGIAITQRWKALLQQYLGEEVGEMLHVMDIGFTVRPRVIGNMLELSIAPRVAGTNSGRIVDFMDIGSVVRVSSGEWLDLIHNMQQRDEVSRAIIASYQALDGSDAVLEIRVE